MPVPVVSAAEAAQCVQSGWTVGLMHACGEPQALVEALVARAPELRRVRMLTAWHQVSRAPYAVDELADSFIPVSTMPARATRHAIEFGHGEYLPLKFGELAQAIAAGRVRVDAAFVTVSPPDEQGLVSLGVSVDYASAMLETARVRVAEVTRHMPRTGGASLVPLELFDFAVRSDRRLLELPSPALTEIEIAIGEHVADLVPNGATLQVGVGAIPNAVLAELGGHQDLGVHSGMVSDGMMTLLLSGAITDAKKTVDPGRTVAASIIGSRELFAAVPHYQALEMHPATYTHAFDVIAAQANFTAINGALEVDLAGNVNAEVAAGRRLSGPGGQPEFAAGAVAAPNGQSIIVLPSTAKGHTVSRIVERLDADVPVTTPGECVTAVVTEYGAADLRGLAPRARAAAIARVSHPDYHLDLLRAAAEL